ncbi:MAG: ion transporter [Cyanobacteria bacterium P01_D01_bin.73]
MGKSIAKHRLAIAMAPADFKTGETEDADNRNADNANRDAQFLTRRDRLRSWLDDLDTPVSWGINSILLGAIVATSATFVATTFDIDPAIAQSLHRFDLCLSVLFIVEYCLRWWSASNRWRYPFQIYSLIDLVAVVPMVLGGWDILYVRLLRSFRILLLLRFFDRRRVLSRLSLADSQVLGRIILTLLCLLFIAAGLIYNVEHNTPNSAIHNFLDAFYFAVVTMTTVGFGDITPLSNAGRLVTLLMILAGITLIPWQVSELVRQFIGSVQKVNQECPNCALAYHDPDAQFCKRCGVGLNLAASLADPVSDSSPSDSAPLG